MFTLIFKNFPRGLRSLQYPLLDLPKAQSSGKDTLIKSVPLPYNQRANTFTKLKLTHPLESFLVEKQNWAKKTNSQNQKFSLSYHSNAIYMEKHN